MNFVLSIVYVLSTYVVGAYLFKWYGKQSAYELYELLILWWWQFCLWFLKRLFNPILLLLFQINVLFKGIFTVCFTSVSLQELKFEEHYRKIHLKLIADYFYDHKSSRPQDLISSRFHSHSKSKMFCLKLNSWNIKI